MKKVVVYKVEQDSSKGHFDTIEDTLSSFREYLDGYMEFLTAKMLPNGERIGILLNEEGKFREDFKPCLLILVPEHPMEYSDVIVGNVVFVHVDKHGNNIDITEDDVEEIRSLCARPFPGTSI